MFLRKYGTGTGADVIIPIIKRGVVDFAVSADWTPASGDVKVSKDGGTEANIATLPVINGTVGWKFVFSDAELQCKSLTVRVVDSATKAIEDQFFIVETYGNASAMFQADLSAANLPANVVQISGDSTAADNLEAAADGTGFNLGAGQIVAASVSGAVGSVSGAVGSVTGNVGGDVVGSVASVLGAVGSVTGAVGSVTGNVGGNLNGNVSGNVSGSVGSVAGAVGSVTGSVGSVVGNVGGSVASVAGAVGSVTGNVGGDVGGKVLGGGSGTISGDGVRAASVTGAVGSVTGSVGSVVGAVELDSAVADQINAIETFATRITTGIAQDGAVWQFTANMLELGPSGTGGSSSVNVLPATGIVADRSAGTTLTPVIGETISQSITVYQSDGTTAVDLSGKTLKVIFETMSGTDVAVVESANITISGTDNNVVTFAYPSAVTVSERTLRFAIRDAAAPLTMYLQGVCSVVAAPKVDA